MLPADRARRLLHLASPVFLVYYLLPVQLSVDITRLAVTLLAFGTAMCIEIGRLGLGIKLFGMRGYEGDRVSAYAQGTIGLALGLLFVDPFIVIPCMFGMAWIDPLCSVARQRGWSRAIPTLAYFGLFLVILTILGAYGWPTRLLFAGLATGTAMALEGPIYRLVDDDFLMLVAPMVVLTATSLILGALSV